MQKWRVLAQPATHTVYIKNFEWENFVNDQNFFSEIYTTYTMSLSTNIHYENFPPNYPYLNNLRNFSIQNLKLITYMVHVP